MGLKTYLSHIFYQIVDNTLNSNVGLLLFFESFFYCYLVTKYNGKYFLAVVWLVLQEGDYIYIQGWRLRVASGATAPGPTLEGAPCFRPMSLSSHILR